MLEGYKTIQLLYVTTKLSHQVPTNFCSVLLITICATINVECQQWASKLLGFEHGNNRAV
jgi:hypothetical protein